MNTWNTLPESNQQRVYKNALATVMSQIRQAENLTPAMVISVDAVCVDNGIAPDYLTSEVALEVPEIGRTDPNNPIDNHCADDKLHFGMPGGRGDYTDEGDDSDEHGAILTARWQRRAATELAWFDLETSGGDGYEGANVNDADADEEDKASQADDGSTQNVENWGHSTRECKDWTVYFRPVKDDYGGENATGSDVSEATTVS